MAKTKKIDYEKINEERRKNRKAEVTLDQTISIYQKDLVPFNNELEDFLDRWQGKNGEEFDKVKK